MWGPRIETRSAGVSKAVDLIQGLKRTDPEHYAHWYRKGRSRAKALEHEVLPSAETVESELVVNRRDDEDRSVIVELGHSLSLWNGLNEDAALTLNCQFGVTSQYVKNSVILGLPSGYQDDLSKARAVLDLIVGIWTPDEATVWSQNREEILRA
jgi:hypothetical protein